MSNNDIDIKLIRPGLSIDPHECEFVRGDLNPESFENDIWEYDQICRVCGKVEHVVRIIERVTFLGIYEKFYGEGK